MKRNARNTIQRTFNQLYGEICWGFHWDRQLNLSLSFGRPLLRIREAIESKSKSPRIRDHFSRRRVSVKGAWWLWLRCAYWKIAMNGITLATGSSSLRMIQVAMARLEGQKLVNVNVDPSTGATRFGFDFGGALEIRRFESESEDELWLLYKPSGYVLSVSGNGRFSHVRGSSADGRSYTEMRRVADA